MTKQELTDANNVRSLRVVYGTEGGQLILQNAQIRLERLIKFYTDSGCDTQSKMLSEELKHFRKYSDQLAILFKESN